MTAISTTNPPNILQFIYNQIHTSELLQDGKQHNNGQPVSNCHDSHSALYSLTVIRTMCGDLCDHIVRLLDLVSASSLARTCTSFARSCVKIHGNNIFQVPPHQSQGANQQITRLISDMESTSFSSASSPASSDAEYDTQEASTDTDLTNPEEEEWEFQMTPDIKRRISLLPQHKTGASLPNLRLNSS